MSEANKDEVGPVRAKVLQLENIEKEKNMKPETEKLNAKKSDLDAVKTEVSEEKKNEVGPVRQKVLRYEKVIQDNSEKDNKQRRRTTIVQAERDPLDQELKQTRSREKQRRHTTKVQPERDPLEQDLKQTRSRGILKPETENLNTNTADLEAEKTTFSEANKNEVVQLREEVLQLKKEIKDNSEKEKEQNQHLTKVQDERDQLEIDLKKTTDEVVQLREEVLQLKKEIKDNSEKEKEQKQHLTKVQDERDQVEKDLKKTAEMHTSQMERQKNLLESRTLQTSALVKSLMEIHEEKQTKLDKMETEEKKLKLKIQQQNAKIAALEAEKTANKSKVDQLHEKLHQLEKDLKDKKEEENQIRKEYWQRLVKLEEDVKKFPKEEDLLKKSAEEFCPVQDEGILNKIRSLFVSKINPENVVNVFHLYNENVLTQQDIEAINATTKSHGRYYGAGELLNRLVVYEGWFSCLVQVLRDQMVKLAYLADTMWKNLGIPETEENKDTIDQVKKKVEIAASTLRKIKVKQSEDRIRCLTFIAQISLNYPSYSTEVGICLCELSFAETCINILKDQLKVPQSKDTLQVIEYTLGICKDYSADSPEFAKMLRDSGAVGTMTDILKETSYTENVHKKREIYIVVEASMSVLRHIAIDVEASPDFKDSKTVEVLLSLINSKNENIQVHAMMALVEILEEEEKIDRLPVSPDLIKIIVKWLRNALEDKETKSYEGFPASLLAGCLADLAGSETNRQKILDAEPLDVFVRILQHENPDYEEQAFTAKCIGKMASNESIRQTIQKWPLLVSALQDLRGSEDADVSLNVDEAVTMIHGHT